MLNDKVVRPAGYYLASIKGNRLVVIELLSCGLRGEVFYHTGDPTEYTFSDFHWIADEPLDLEAVKLY